MTSPARDLGVPAQARSAGGHALATKQHRHGHAQAATNLLFPCFQQRLCSTNFLQRALTTFIKKGAVVGQALAAGRTLKQTYPQPLFKPSDTLSYRRARQMQTNCGLSKTSASTAATKTGISFSVSVMDCIFSVTNRGKLIATGYQWSTVNCHFKLI